MISDRQLEMSRLTLTLDYNIFKPTDRRRVRGWMRMAKDREIVSIECG